MSFESFRELLPGFAWDPRALCALVLCSCASVAAYKLAWRWRIQNRTEQAKKRREDGLKHMAKAIERFQKQNPGLYPGAILSLSMVELAESLQDGTLSPDRVLYTYLGKALEVHRELNCLTDYLQECESQLRELKTQREKGPLYGIPISIKQSIPYKGYDCSCGLLQFHDVIEQEDSVIVRVLKKQGAIPFVKTNIPQSLLCFDCSNPLYGQTLNPLNRKKSPGGSSGGEGALIGGGGSLIGLGSDLGGSVRLPASFCGICSIKPTAYRISVSGMSDPIDGNTSVRIVIGPMARDVDSLALCMRALLCEDMFRLDPVVPPIPFNEEVYSSTRPLRIGYYDTDDYFPSNPGMRRVVLETKKLLEDAGHTLVVFTPPSMDTNIFDLFGELFFADGGSTFASKLFRGEKFHQKKISQSNKGNLVDPHLKPAISICTIPSFIKKTLGVLLKPWSPRIASCLTSLHKSSTVTELWAHQKMLQDYFQVFVAEWNRLKLDVVLCPMLGPAFNISFPGELLPAVNYTVRYNLLNFPAGVVPVGAVTPEDERQMKNYKGHNNDMWDRLMTKALEGSVGLPLSVQCVALPWQEELCLRFMKEVENLTGMKKRRN